MRVLEPVAFIMTRKMLLGISRRAEALRREAGSRPAPPGILVACSSSMTMRSMFRTTARGLAAGVGFVAVSYAAYVGYAWLRYGDVEAAASRGGEDTLLDRFMPSYEIAERHQIRINAPADATFEAATTMDLQQSPIVRAIFKGREWIMCSRPAPALEPGSFVGQMRRIGWGELAAVPGRQLVMGAVTQPWMADVVFRPLAPDQFAAFDNPGYVKIVWTLRADPIGPDRSVFRTETRAVATDPSARTRFRRYWSMLSPGIILIRWASLGPLKADAERRARNVQAGSRRLHPETEGALP